VKGLQKHVEADEPEEDAIDAQMGENLLGTLADNPAAAGVRDQDVIDEEDMLIEGGDETTTEEPEK
jgi:hypothetical protein